MFILTSSSTVSSFDNYIDFLIDLDKGSIVVEGVRTFLKFVGLVGSFFVIDIFVSKLYLSKEFRVVSKRDGDFLCLNI